MSKRQLYQTSFGQEIKPVHKRSDNREFIDFKARVVQGDVTINLGVNDAEPAKRLGYQQQFSEKERMGHFAGKHQVNVVRYDLVFVVNGEDRRVKTMLPMEQRNQAIVSFNAFPLMGAKSRDEFQRFFRFMGIAKTSYRHGEVTQPLNGLAVQHKGATSIPNTSSNNFNAGDKIAFRVPHVDPQLRSKQQKDMPSFKHLHGDRLTAYPELVTYSDINDLPGRATRYLFRQGKANSKGIDANASIRRLSPHQSADLGQLERFAIAQKRGILQSAWNAVAVLDAYGLITINTPESTSVRAYSSLDNSLLRNNLNSVLNSGRPNVVKVGERAEVQGSSARGGAAGKVKANQLLWLAQKLDLVHDSARVEDSTFLPSQTLQDALVAVNNAALFSQDSSMRRFDARRFLNPSTPTSALGAVRLPAAAHYSPDTYAKQLAKSQADAAAGYYQTAVEAKAFVDSTIGATALNYSKPKHALDICL